MPKKERPVRWTGEVSGDGMDFNAQLALKEAADLRKLQEESQEVASQQVESSAETVFIDRLTGLPIGQEQV